jgi:nucleoside-diphosphate-sugar epimerase
MTGTILLTGATGYLGRRIAARLLAATDDRLLLTARTPERAARLRTEPAVTAAQGRVEVVPADLGTVQPFGAVDARRITRIVHAAALTAFTVGRAEAQAVNVGGTAAVARLARRCPRLERVVVLSTLYSAGRAVGPIAEKPHPPGGSFANHYEWSKARAEALLFASFADLPLSVARLATVVADGDDGRVGQYNAFHNTLKLLFYGLLSVLPGRPKTPVHLATADFTTAGVVRLLRRDVPGGIYHLGPSPDETATLGDLIGLAFDVFATDSGFRRRRLLRPEFCDIETFRHLVDASRSLGRSPLGQALQSVAPFAEQLFLPKEFATDRLDAAWPDRLRTDPWALVEATTAHLIRTRWGRNAEEEP